MNGIVNLVKAGSAVPIKFSLDGDQGLDILAAGSPTITFTACNAGAQVDAIETTVTAGGSSLSYDPVAEPVRVRLEDAQDVGGQVRHVHADPR